MTGLMRIQIMAHKTPNLLHYLHIVPQLSEREYSSGLGASLNIKIRHCFLWAVKRLSAQIGSLWFILSACSQSAVPSDSTRTVVCCFFILFHYYFFFMPSPSWSSQPKHISSQLEMSESIAMETELKSLECRSPLWLHPIRFKEKLSALHYFAV